MSEKKQISIPTAVAQSLGQQGAIVVSRYELANVIWRIYKQESFNGAPLRSHREALDRAAFNRHEATLVQNGVLRSIPGLPENAAYVLVGASVSDARVLACAVDPFCYVSHLSAMEFHGLTDRMPEQLYLSSPAATRWRAFAAERMKKDLGDAFEAYVRAGLPPLQRTAMIKLANRPVHMVTSLHLGAFRHIKDQNIRVSTLGRTFLDMLHEPLLCGGLSHVLAVFREYAVANKRLIFDEIDQHGKSIDKVRAGFIFEEICKVTDPRIDAWVAYAQRGGSRKLDASGDYSATFSEKWALSINVPIGAE
jgi:predicted transcriptional regulator of viral defense system